MDSYLTEVYLNVSEYNELELGTSEQLSIPPSGHPKLQYLLFPKGHSSGHYTKLDVA